MKLYIANCTGQFIDLYTRLDYCTDDQGRKLFDAKIPPRLRKIQPREQILFADFDHISQLESIVQQLEPFGAVAAAAVKTAKAKGRVRLLWQQDQPVPYPILRDVIEHNMGYLSAEGADRRKRFAIASDRLLAQTVAEAAQQANLSLDAGAPKMFETEVESDEEEDPDVPGLVAKGFRIKHDAKAPAPTKGRARRAA